MSSGSWVWVLLANMAAREHGVGCICWTTKDGKNVIGLALPVLSRSALVKESSADQDVAILDRHF